MYGTNFSRTLNVLKYILKQPKFVPEWFYINIRRKTPLQIELPWLSYPSIKYLENFINREHRVFEFGGGGSTLWFAKRCQELICTENNKYWGDMIWNEYQKNVKRYSAKIMMNIVEVSERPTIVDYPNADNYINTIFSNSPYDIILVDGIDGIEGQKNYRVECICKAKECLNAGGIIILDDSWRNEYSCVPDILNEFDRLEFWGLGPCRLGVTKTDIYVCKNVK
jgi:hypothetical protein